MAQPVHAVITGDLIASTRQPQARADAAMSALQAAARGWPETDLRFTRFRGDGWQVLLPRAGGALRVALVLAARLAAAETGIATRLAIGIGGITAGGTRDLSDAAGAAFTRSGRALDAMPRGRVWAVSGGAGLPAWVQGYVELAEWHAAGWTAGQAAVVADYLTPRRATQEERAAQMGLSRQAWKARLDGSGIATWDPALAAWEAWDGAGAGDD
ncbi:MAG: hypothetical protein RIR62_349 [Pseudomonadota bacterium]